MGQRFTELSDKLQTFIHDQPMFFVATAARDGRVNLSPKGMQSLKVLGPQRIAWLNLTGSGNETASHLLDSPRMTLMWCAFKDQPMILRCYGEAKTLHTRDPEYAELVEHFPDYTGARQIFDLQIDLVQTSCGFAVPLMDYVADRQILIDWAEKRGREGVEQYWVDRNQLSIDGKPTGILPE